MGIRILIAMLISVYSQLAFSHQASTPVIDALKAVCESQLASEPIRPVDGSWKNKTLIIDTNVIFNDPNFIYRYPGATLIITGTVTEEVDDNKKDPDIGKAARDFNRMLSEMIKNGGELSKGVALSNESILKVDSKDFTHLLEGTTYNLEKPDNKIVATALAYTLQENGYGNVILISDDLSTRIKANEQGIASLPFEYEWVQPKTKDRPAYLTYKVSREKLEEFHRTGYVDKPDDLKMIINEFVMLEADGMPGSVDTIARFFHERENPDAPPLDRPLMHGLRRMTAASEFPVMPKNIEQHMALDVLFEQPIELVVLESPAGTGKTFLSLAAGTMQSRAGNLLYKAVIMTRTLVQIGKENLGAFPGSKNEKLSHWYEGFSDAMASLKNLLTGKKSQSLDSFSSNTVQVEKHRGQYQSRKRYPKGRQPRGPGSENMNGAKESMPEMVAFPHIRGRNFEQVFGIFDETQNSSRHEMLSFGTRAAMGTKFVISGDSSQIDVPYLNERNNGLAILISLIRGGHLSDDDQSRVAVVHMTEGVRSPLAELFRKLFEKAKTSY